MKRIGVTCAALILAISAMAGERDPSGYEQILLPVYFGNVRLGAHGSMWDAEFLARNNGIAGAQIFNTECAFFCECVPLTCTVADTPPGGYFYAQGARPDDNPANPGYLLYVNRSSADHVAMQLRARDISRSATSFGTEMPVVREADTRVGTIHLLDVPMDPRFRQHLRVYGLGPRDQNAMVRVRVFNQLNEDPLLNVLLTLTKGGVAGLPTSNEFPTHPAYGEISSLGTAVGAGIDRVRIEVISEQPDLKFWAFVAVTNNDTQHVTLVTPQ